MKKVIYPVVIVICLCFIVSVIRAEKLAIGARFPVENISNEKKPADNTIIVFMPSLTYDCDYASMLTQSFYYYFDQRLAFEGAKKSPVTRVFFIVRDKPDAAKSTQNIIGGMNVIFDEKGDWFSYFEIKQPLNKNADSTVVLLDSKENIALIDNAYRSQGEHLKPLENKLKELNGLYEKPAAPAKKPLKIGDKAPDFRINEKETLSDLRGTVVLLSFYPAAFSGTLLKPYQPGDLIQATVAPSWYNADIMTCSIQLTLLDKKPLKAPVTPRFISITNSTNSLLEKWKNVLGTYDIEYANDPDRSVSLSYFAYNPNGYNNRVSVIVDKKGKIAHIDESFEFNDQAMLNEKIEKLLK